METEKNYLVLRKTYLGEVLKENAIIAICNNKMDAYLNLLSCFVSLKSSYVIDYEFKLKNRIFFERVKDVQNAQKEIIEFDIYFGEPNMRFCLYDLCDLSDVISAMKNLKLFNA